MAPRNSRSRKTADRMAGYKIAANKKRQVSPKTGSRTSPRNKSGKNSTVQAGSEHNGSKEQIATSNNAESGMLDSSRIQPPSPTADSGNADALDMFDPDTVIPETPEQVSRVQSRKRVHAPIRLELSEDDANDRAESGKPSKKRRGFHTPLRERVVREGVVAPFVNTSDVPQSTQPELRISRHNSPSQTDEISESEGLEMTVDDLIKAPVPSAQKTLFPQSTHAGNASRCRTGNNSMFHAFKRSVHNESLLQRKDVDRSAKNAANLDLMAISSATITRMFETFSAKVMSEMRDSREAQLAEIRKVGATIGDAVACEIRGLHGLVEMVSSGSKTVGSVRTGGKTSLSDWEKKLDALTPYVNAIFGKKLISRILCCNVPLKCVGIYQKYEGSGISDVERASMSAQTLMFSLQPRDKKFQYSGDVGQLHSDFKFSVVQNCFFNVQRDTFRLFKGEGKASGGEGPSMGVNNNPVLSRPSWLSEGKVLMDHINQARSFIETAGQTRKDKIRRCPTPDDIACHGALRVYRQLGSRLHDGRGSLRVAFFVGVGYLLIPWKDRIQDFHRGSVQLSMDDGENLCLRTESVPYTAQFSANDDAAKVGAADAKNKEILRQLFAEWPGMILTASHEVKITKGNTESSKHRRNTEQKRVIHRYINLIDVACECCVEYCGAESREAFLRTHKSALQCVMLFALLFKAFCVEFLSMKSMESSAACFVPEPTEVKVFGSCLKDFIPGLHTQKSLLSQKCLQMTHSTYEMLNQSNGETYESVDDDAEERDGRVIDMRHIVESADQGVCIM